jgi:hypothetical protein
VLKEPDMNVVAGVQEDAVVKHVLVALSFTPTPVSLVEILTKMVVVLVSEKGVKVIVGAVPSYVREM